MCPLSLYVFSMTPTMTIVSLNNINGMTCIKKMQCVYCAVRTDISSKDSTNFAALLLNSLLLNICTSSLLCRSYQKDERANPSMNALFPRETMSFSRCTHFSLLSALVLLFLASLLLIGHQR